MNGEKEKVFLVVIFGQPTGCFSDLVRVSVDFISSCELAAKVDPKKFEYGDHIFRKATYRLI